MKYTFINLIFWVVFHGVFYSQEVSKISLTDFLNTVKTENTTLLKTVEEIRKAKADFNQTNALFLPNVSASHTAMLTTNPLMAFGFKLNQGIITQSDFNPAVLNNPSATRTYATQIQVEQPLLNLDGIYQRKAAKDVLEATKLQTLRVEDYVIFESKKSYMQLQVAYKNVEVLVQIEQFVNQLQQQTQNYYKQGLIQKSDVLAVEIRQLEVKNQLQSAKTAIKDVSEYIQFLMNKPTPVVLQPSDSLTIVFHQQQLMDSITNRADIQAMELATTAQKQLLQSTKLSFLPRLNAFGSYELYDNQIFRSNSSGYLVGVQLKWDIFQGSKKIHQLQKSTATYEQSKLDLQEYKQKNNLEIAKINRLLVDSEQQVSLAKLSLEQAQEILRIKKNRFDQGLEKTTDVLAAESDVAQKNIALYQAIYQYNYTKFYLEYLTKQN